MDTLAPSCGHHHTQPSTKATSSISRTAASFWLSKVSKTEKVVRLKVIKVAKTCSKSQRGCRETYGSVYPDWSKNWTINFIINMCFKPRVIVESWKINTRLNSMFDNRNSKSTEKRELKQEEQEQWHMATWPHGRMPGCVWRRRRHKPERLAPTLTDVADRMSILDYPS